MFQAKIVIVGGMHSNYPQALLRDPRVELLVSTEERKWYGKSLPKNTKQVVMTRHVSHRTSDWLRSMTKGSDIAYTGELLGSGEIRDSVDKFLKQNPLQRESEQTVLTPAVPTAQTLSTPKGTVPTETSVASNDPLVCFDNVATRMRTCLEGGMAGFEELMETFMEVLIGSDVRVQEVEALLKTAEKAINEARVSKTELYSEDQKLRQQNEGIRTEVDCLRKENDQMSAELIELRHIKAIFDNVKKVVSEA